MVALNEMRTRGQRSWASVLRWFDNEARDTGPVSVDARRLDWLRVLPFVVLHLGCLGVIWVGASATAVAVAVAP